MRRCLSIRMSLERDTAGPSPLMLPAVGSNADHTGAEAARTVGSETCGTVAIALDKCK